MPETVKCPCCEKELKIKPEGYYKEVVCLDCHLSIWWPTAEEIVTVCNRRAQPDGCEWEKRQIVDCFGDTRTGYHCSNCGFWSDTEWPHCPKCGAKMNGKRLGE